MSRSNHTEVINPSQRFLEWVGSKGCLKYFDKSKGEKGEQVFVPLPFSFLVLDRLHTIKGFSDSDQSGFWSNEVRDLKKEPLTVRTKKGVVATGLYSTLANILNQGASYCQSVYIAFKGEDGKLSIGCLQLSGSAIGPWIETCKGKDIYKFAVTIADSTPMKKGATNYFAPNYKLSNVITPETELQAIELDKELQEYLKAYFKRTTSEQQEIESTEVVTNNRMKDVDMDEVNTQLHNEASPEPVDEYNDLPF